MAGITSAGVGSGLDLESIISATIAAENTPKLQALSKKKTSLDVSISGYGAVKSAYSNLQSIAETLSKSTTFAQRTAKIAQPEGTTYFSATTSNTTSVGSYNIEVTSLAKGSRAVSQAGSFATGSDVVSASGGTMTFTAGTKTFDLTVAAGTTLVQLRDQINSNAANFGLSASIINTGGASPEARFVLASTVTGQGNDISVTGSSAEFNKLVTSSAFGLTPGMQIAPADQATDAVITIDGIESRSKSNVFTSAIQDLTLTVSKTTPAATPINLKVDTDKDSVKKSIQSFIDNFNKVVTVINEQTAVGGALQSDASVKFLKNSMVRMLGMESTGTGNIKTLYDLGIKLEKDGKISINSSAVNTLDEALTNSFDNVGKFFSTTDTGLASVFKADADRVLASDGMFKKATDVLNERLKGVQKDTDNHNYRMDQLEKRLREQYTQLDVTIAKMRATGNYVSAQLSSLPGFTKK